MSFIATAPNNSNPENKLITAGGFWPDISLDDCRDVMKLDGTVTNPRLEHALINAALQVNRELAVWRETQQSKGHQALADVPAEQINNKSEYVHLYQRAVYCFAKANLIERYNDYDTTAKGTKDSDELNETTDSLRRDGRFAVRDILQTSHVTVELI